MAFDGTRWKLAAVLVILVIVAVVLAACQPERFSQCDPTNTPGANCYRPARPLPNQ